MAGRIDVHQHILPRSYIAALERSGIGMAGLAPTFPFGATANPDVDLPTDTVRQSIVEMIAHVVGPGVEER